MTQAELANPTGLIAAAYVRVSTGRQEKEQTIDAQIDEIRQMALANGDRLADELIFEDDGWTGELLQRPGLDRMREAAMAGRFQVLYVYDRGRLSRIFAYQEILIEELENHRILFKSIHDVDAITPEEKAVQAMQGVFHQYERVKISERFRMARLFKARNGVIINAFLPYGYNRIRRSEEAPARAEVNPDHARIAGLIRQWYGNDRLGIPAIIERLFELKVPSPRFGHERWGPYSVRYVLRCGAYHTGVVYYQKTESIVARNPRQNSGYRRVKRTSRRVRPTDQWLAIPVPKLFPDDGLYERIQERIGQHRRYAPRNRKYGYLLVGKVTCGCGERRIGDGYGDGHHYYRCLQKTSRLPVNRTCTIPGVNAGLLDHAVWAKLESVLSNPAVLERHATGWRAARRDEDERVRSEKERLTGLLSAASEEEQRYIKAYGSGALDYAQLRPHLTEVKHRKERYAKELKDLTDKRAPAQALPDLTAVRQAVAKLVKSLNFEDKAMVVRELVDKVVIQASQTAEIWGKIPLAVANMGLPNENCNLHLSSPCLEFRIALTLPKLKRHRKRQ